MRLAPMKPSVGNHWVTPKVKSRVDRKAFAELLAAAARREFDLLVFWSLAQ